MKTLDRYIVRTFLSTAFLFLVVMLTLRIVLDLFFNMDEFTEQSGSFLGVLGDIWEYYATQSLVYFIELGGLIIVASAGFSLAKMNYTNELTAMLASGVSLHRVVLPIIICSMLMGGVVILDQELLVPRFAHILIRKHDEAGKRVKKRSLSLS
ncbi:MAG: LptF/LptG family permease [Planctomycetes bacterium]|nr:LptF/LptG family permease [Planctomycetota bacterium]